MIGWILDEELRESFGYLITCILAKGLLQNITWIPIKDYYKRLLRYSFIWKLEKIIGNDYLILTRDFIKDYQSYLEEKLTSYLKDKSIDSLEENITNYLEERDNKLLEAIVAPEELQPTRVYMTTTNTK